MRYEPWGQKAVDVLKYMGDEMTYRPLLVLDFDGVLHSYNSGWKGADVIPDPPVPGSRGFCEDAVKEFDVLILSTRCSHEGGTEAIREWLRKYEFSPRLEVSEDGVKPPAHLTLDDRAMQFTGLFPHIDYLKGFKPWNKI